MEDRNSMSQVDSVPTSERPSRFSAFSMEKREQSRTPEKRKIRTSRIFLCASGAISLLSLGALTSFIILDYWLLSAEVPSSESTALAATILDPLGLLSLVLLVIFSLISSGHGWLKRVIIPFAGALVAVAGACMSFSTILIKKTDVTKSLHEKHDEPGSSIPFPAEVAIWSLTVLAQIVFYTVVILGQFSSDRRQRRLSFVSERRNAPARPPTPPTPLRIVAPPYALPQASASFNPETEPKERRSSWRDSLHSLHQVVRPMNSRTRLLGQRNSVSRDSTTSQMSDSRSVATTTHSGSFETWDTSALEKLDAQLREHNAIAFPTQPGKTALEPIPGSRPVSPARALDGPFPYTSTPTESMPNLANSQSNSQERIDRPLTALSTSSRIERPPTAFSYTSRPRASSRASRPTSPEELPPPTEAHIHPLFRSDSPVPPPATTPGTNITASPYSGHVITVPSSRASSRTRSTTSPSVTKNRSRAASPCVTRNPSIDTRNPSMDDVSPISGRSRSRSSSTTRAPSVTGAMTPPIPEFVLSASRERII